VRWFPKRSQHKAGSGKLWQGEVLQPVPHCGHQALLAADCAQATYLMLPCTAERRMLQENHFLLQVTMTTALTDWSVLPRVGCVGNWVALLKICEQNSVNSAVNTYP